MMISRIEQLRIFFYSKRSADMVVSNPTLKHFALDFPCYSGKVLIESKNLESLEFSFFGRLMWEIDLTSGARVRNLILHKANDQGRKLMHEFPLLEKLMISGCRNVHNFYVSHQNLASFLLLHHVDEEVRIDAPKLKSFEYTGGLTLFPGIEASKELETRSVLFKPRNAQCSLVHLFKKYFGVFCSFQVLESDLQV